MAEKDETAHIGHCELFLIVDALDGRLCLVDIPVLGGLLVEFEQTTQILAVTTHDLVEDVIGALTRRLSNDTRLLQQI